MEFETFLETINTHPALYFFAGLVVGYFLHGLIKNGFSSAFQSKKPSRYQSKQGGNPAKRSSSVVELNEPSFDWTEAAAKKVTPPAFISLPMDQHRNKA